MDRPKEPDRPDREPARANPPPRPARFGGGSGPKDPPRERAGGEAVHAGGGKQRAGDCAGVGGDGGGEADGLPGYLSENLQRASMREREHESERNLKRLISSSRCARCVR